MGTLGIIERPLCLSWARRARKTTEDMHNEQTSDATNSEHSEHYSNDAKPPMTLANLLIAMLSPGSSAIHHQQYRFGIGINLLYIAAFAVFFLALGTFHFFPVPWLLFLIIVLASLWFGVFLSYRHFPSQIFPNRWLLQINIALSSFWFPLLMLSFLGVQYVMQHTYISSESMQPNIYAGDLVLVDRSIYFQRQPDYGDLVMIEEFDRNKNTTKRAFFGRIIALPGDIIQLQGVQPFVNNKQLAQYYPKDEKTYLGTQHLAFELPANIEPNSDYPNTEPPKWYPILAPEQMLFSMTETLTLEGDFYFILGDNRGSKDNRTQQVGYGSIVHRSKIKGQPRYVLYNTNLKDGYKRFGLRLR